MAKKTGPSAVASRAGLPRRDSAVVPVERMRWLRDARRLANRVEARESRRELETPEMAAEVARGLARHDKELPAWLFYDEEGSRLFELITDLPEYYLSRAERSIFEEHADAIVAAAAAGSDDALHVVELGAGTAAKSQILLRALVRRQGSATFHPSDVSLPALAIAVERLAREEPGVTTRPIVAHHERALRTIRRLEGRKLLIFIGSSIGNYTDDEARRLLRRIRTSLRPGAALLLGTDLRKSADVLVPAYDDAQGVTAAFNKNVLARINRELGGRFDLDRFRHVALWNERASRVEMHLESLVDQVVHIGALGLDVPLRRGERIHTESSVKYDDAMVDRLLASSGFRREKTFVDRDDRFAVHLARRA